MTDMANWLRMWFPFSTRGQREKLETKEQLQNAHEMYENSLFQKEDYIRIYEEQKKLSEELRDERRKNHFSSLFQQVPPRNSSKEDK